MIRATLDTNTLASGALAQPGTITSIMAAWRRGVLEIVISDHILEELARTLRKPYFAARLKERDRGDYLKTLLEFAAIVEITAPIPSVLSDRGDNLVLATALSAGVSYVVTGDRELQALGEFEGVRILSARELLALIQEDDTR